MNKLGSSVMMLLFTAACVVVTSIACHSEAPTPDTHGARRGRSPRAAVPPAAAPHYPVIVRIVGRNQAITVTAGPVGPLYSAATSDGKIIVAGATLERLRQEHPDVYRQLEPGIAVESEHERGTGGSSRPDEAARVQLMMSSVD